MRITIVTLLICFFVVVRTRAQQSISKSARLTSFVAEGDRCLYIARYDSAILYYSRAIVIDSLDVRPIFNRSRCYLISGDFKAAIADLNRCIEIKPGDRDALTQRAIAYQRNGFYARAIQDYSKILDAASDASLYNNRGLCYQKLESNESALVDFSVAISKKPTDTQYYINRAAVYLRMANASAAWRDLSRCIELGGTSKTVYFSRALCSDDLKNFTDAIADYSKAIMIDNAYVQAYRNRGACYYARGDYQMAAQDFARVLSGAPVYDDCYNAGSCYENLDAFDLAAKSFTRALELKPRDIDALFQRGTCNMKLKKFDLAIADWNSIISLDDRNYKAYVQCAEAYSAKGDYDLALPDFDKALSIQPNNQSISDAREECAQMLKSMKPAGPDAVVKIPPERASDPQAYLDRGKYYESVLNENAAIRDYSRAIKLNSAYADAYRDRAGLLLKRGQDRGALADFSILVALHAADQITYYQRGLLLEKMGDLDNAINDFTSAIELNGRFFSAYYHRGIVFYRENNLTASIRDFGAVLKATGNRDAECWFRQGVAYYDLGNYDSAIDDFNEALKLKTNEQTIVQQKLAYVAENKFSEASALPDVTVNLGNYFNDKFFNFLSGYIRICTEDLSVDNYKTALAELLKLLEDARIETFNNRFSSLVTTTARNVAIQYANVLAKTGWIYEKLGIYDKALEYYQKAMVIDSNVQHVTQKVTQIETIASRLTAQSGPEIRLLVPQGEGIAYENRDGTIYVSGTVSSSVGIRTIRVNDVLPNVSGSGFFQVAISDTVKFIKVDATDYNGNLSTLKFNIEKKIPLSGKTDTLPILPENERFHAILIACSEYKDENWPALPTTVPESEALRKVLIRKYNFDESSVDTIYNKSRSEILGILSNKLQGLTDQDNLLIFFSGHGYYKPSSNTAFWVPLGADNEYDYISNDDINKLLTGISARHVLIMADACFSGALRSGLNYPNKYEYNFSSRQLLTSGGIEVVPGKSVFMQMVLTTLRDNQEPYLSVRTLYGLIFNGVRNQTGDEPLLRDLQVYGSEGGQFYFKKSQAKK